MFLVIWQYFHVMLPYFDNAKRDSSSAAAWADPCRCRRCSCFKKRPGSVSPLRSAEISNERAQQLHLSFIELMEPGRKSVSGTVRRNWSIFKIKYPVQNCNSATTSEKRLKPFNCVAHSPMEEARKWAAQQLQGWMWWDESGLSQCP